jgi:hypothetical protein
VDSGGEPIHVLNLGFAGLNRRVEAAWDFATNGRYSTYGTVQFGAMLSVSTV